MTDSPFDDYEKPMNYDFDEAARVKREHPDVELTSPEAEPVDPVLKKESERLMFLEKMEKERHYYELGVVRAAVGWKNNLVSFAHNQKLQEAVLKLEHFDRDKLRKYVKKFDIPADDAMHKRLLELEELLG